MLEGLIVIQNLLVGMHEGFQSVLVYMKNLSTFALIHVRGFFALFFHAFHVLSHRLKKKVY